MRPEKEIRGENIVLREQRADDAEFFARWFSDPQVMFQCAFTETTDVDAEKKAIEANNNKDDAIWYTITDLDGNILGETGLLRMWPAWHCTDLSIIIPDPEKQHKGYGTEAIKLMLDMAFGQFDMNRVAIGVVAQNTNALGFYSKIGFKSEGIQEQGYFYNNEYSNFVMMRLLSQEWKH